MGQRDGMWRKFARRTSKVGRFGWKHRKRAFGLVAGVALAYVAIYFAYVGTVTIVQVLVVVGSLVGAGLLAHHDNMKLRRELADQPKPSFSQQKEWARGRGEPYRRPNETPETIRVRSHRNDGHGVTEHTRRRPGSSGTGNGPTPPKGPPSGGAQRSWSRWEDLHAGMRFERPDGRWEDARGRFVEPFDHDTAWPNRQDADRARWGAGG